MSQQEVHARRGGPLRHLAAVLLGGAYREGQPELALKSQQGATGPGPDQRQVSVEHANLLTAGADGVHIDNPEVDVTQAFIDLCVRRLNEGELSVADAAKAK